MNYRLIVLTVAGIFWSVPAVSHHSSVMHYIMDELVTVEGVVNEFLLVNPHARIYFEVTTADGETQRWMAEGEAASVLRRQDWTDETVKQGQFIRITGNPARDGRNLVEWRSIILPDGSELGGGNGQGDERDELFRQRLQRERGN